MPFINDLIESNKEKTLENRAKSSFPFVFEPKEVMSLLRSRIIGQQQVLDDLENMLLRVKADIGDKSKPLGVHLFVGSTGVGKTEIARLLAKAIQGSENSLCRIDMNTLAQEHYAASITGAPPGYVGSKEGLNLFDEETAKGSYAKPGIVLFDELEKADNRVIRSLMGILERGALKLTAGNKTLDFTNSIILMTSNIGASDIWSGRKNWWNQIKKRLKLQKEKELWVDALYKHFDPEFLNRIDQIHYFNDIDENFFEKVLEIELAKLNTRLERKNVQVYLTVAANEYLAKKQNLTFGARAIERLIRTNIEPLVAEKLINGFDDQAITIDSKNQEIFVKTE